MSLEVWQLVIAIAAVIVSVVEIYSKTKNRSSLLEELQCEVNIYSALESSKGFKEERAVLQKLRNSIREKLNEQMDGKEKNPFYVNLIYNISMLLLASCASMIIVFISVYTGTFGLDVANALLYFLGSVAFVEVVVNVADVFRWKKP